MNYSNLCDDECNVCGRYADHPGGGHFYDNEQDDTCNECGFIYDNDCDYWCDACYTERETLNHVFDDGQDTNCNVAVGNIMFALMTVNAANGVMCVGEDDMLFLTMVRTMESNAPFVEDIDRAHSNQ